MKKIQNKAIYIAFDFKIYKVQNYFHDKNKLLFII